MAETLKPCPKTWSAWRNWIAGEVAKIEAQKSYETQSAHLDATARQITEWFEEARAPAPLSQEMREKLARAIDPDLGADSLEPCMRGSRNGIALAAADRVIAALTPEDAG